MPLYDFRAACGETFEYFLTNWQDDYPSCPHCDGPVTKLPSRINSVRGRTPPPGADNAPTSWAGTHRGDREYVAHWRRRLDERARFEDRNPEFVTRRDAVAAHEGTFERAPLTYRELAARAATTRDATHAAAEASAERTATPAAASRTLGTRGSTP